MTATATSATTNPLDIELLLPGAWVDVAPIGEDSGEGYRNTVAELAGIGIPAALPSSIRLMLASLAAQSEEAILVSYFLDAAAGADGDGIDFLFASTAVLAYDLDEPQPIDGLRADLRSNGAGATLALVDEVILGARPAVRRSALRKNGDGGTILDVRYYVPIDERPSLVVICFSTPNVDLERDWLVLFDSIASSLRVGATSPMRG